MRRGQRRKAARLIQRGNGGGVVHRCAGEHPARVGAALQPVAQLVGCVTALLALLLPLLQRLRLPIGAACGRQRGRILAALRCKLRCRSKPRVWRVGEVRHILQRLCGQRIHMGGSLAHAAALVHLGAHAAKLLLHFAIHGAVRGERFMQRSQVGIRQSIKAPAVYRLRCVARQFHVVCYISKCTVNGNARRAAFCGLAAKLRKLRRASERYVFPAPGYLLAKRSTDAFITLGAVLLHKLVVAHGGAAAVFRAVAKHGSA